MKSRQRVGVATANPFVAFADIAIAMAFIFALCTLALSKVLSDMTRDKQEHRTQDGYLSALKARFPDSVDIPAAWVNGQYDKRRNRVVMRQNVVEGRFSANGSYERMEITNGYDFGAVNPRDQDDYVKLGALALASKQEGGVDYVFLDPVVEPGELEVARRYEQNLASDRRYSQSLDSDRDLALARFDAIEDLWRRHQILAGPLERPVPNDKLDPNYVVLFGSEHLYQNAQDQLNKAKAPGRVDVVMFFKDKLDSIGQPVAHRP